MDTKAPLLIILSLGVAVMIVNGSGAADVINGGPADELQSGDELQDAAGDHNVNEGYNGSIDPSSDSDIVGLILGSIPKFIGLLAVPGMLSAELMRLGLWWWAAIPLGIFGNIVTYVGGLQFVSGRIYK